jgi:hypothetical protein
MKTIVLTLLLCWMATTAYSAFNKNSFGTGTFGVAKTTTNTTKFKK